MSNFKLMVAITAWFRAFRLPAQLNLVFPMLVGLTQYAPCGTAFQDLSLLRSLGISLLLQAMIMYSNEASDAATDDPSARTIISGGAGVGAQGLITPVALRRAAILSGGFGLLACLSIGGGALGLMWLIAAMLVWAYDGRRFQLSRHPLGCLVQATGVGIVAPLLAGWSVVSPVSLAWPGVWMGAWPALSDCILGLCLGFSGHILTALPDAVLDRRVGKVTIVVRVGENAAFLLMLAGLTCASAILLWQSSSDSCSTADSLLWANRAGCVAVANFLLFVAWRLRCVSSVRLAGLSLELWLSGFVSAVLWFVWISR